MDGNPYLELVPKQDTNDTPVNPYDEIVASDMDRQAAAIRQSVSVGMETKPEDQARRMKLAKTTGLPVAAVAVSQSAIEKKTKLDSIDYVKMVKDNPNLARWLKNPDNAALSHADHKNLSVLEKSLTFLKPAVQTARAIPAGLQKFSTNVTYGAGRLGSALASDFIGKPLARILPGQPTDPFATMRDAFTELQKQGLDLGDAIAGEQADSFTGRAIVAGGESLGQMLPGLLATVITKNPQYALLAGAAGAGLQASSTGLDKGLSAAQSLAYGAEDATAEYVTELIPMGKLVKDLKAGAPFWSLLGNQIVREVPAELVATPWQNFNQWANLNADKPFSDYLKQLPEDEAATLISTITTTVLTAGFAHGVQKAVRHVEKQAKRKLIDTMVESTKAVDGKQRMDAAAKAVSDADLTTISPEDMRRYIKHVAPDEAVSLSADDAATFFQSNPDAATALQENAPEVYAQLAVSEATGSDVKIPMEDYLTSLGDWTSFLNDHIKVGDGTMSFAEYESSADNLIADISAEAERAINDAGSEFNASSQKVRASFSQSLTDTKRFTPDVVEKYSELMSSITASLASRSGMTPEEFADKYQLLAQTPDRQVQQAQQRADEIDHAIYAIRSGNAPSDSQVRGQSLLDFLKEAGGLKDSGGELKARDANAGRKPFKKNLVHDKGNSLDKAAELAQEAGFIPERDINKLLDGIDSELAGEPVYADANFNQDMEDQSRTIGDVQQRLHDLGIDDISGMSNADVRDALGADYNQKGKPVAVLTGDEVLSLDGDVTKAVTKYFNAELRGRDDVSFTDADGEIHKVIFKTKGLKKYRHGVPHDQGKAQLLPSVPDIIKKGKYLGRDAVEQERKDKTVAFHFFDADVEIAGELMTVTVSVGEDQTGKYFYNLRHDDDPVLQKKKGHLVKPDVSDPEAGDLNASIVQSSKNDNKGEFFQSSEEKNLYVVHNLSSENLAHAEKMGGIAVPSLAVNKVGTGALTGFGEITLIAGSDLIDSKSAKTFNADVYSPRYPSTERVVSHAGYRDVFAGVNAIADKYGLSHADKDLIQRNEIDSFKRSESIKAAYLDSLGKSPRVKMTTDTIPPRMRKFAGKDSYELYRSNAFAEAVEGENNDKRQKFVEHGRMTQEDADAAFGEKPSDNMLYSRSRSVANMRKGKYPSSSDNRVSIGKRFDSLSKKQKTEYNQWVDDKVESVTDKEQIFDGHTNSGARKLLPHNLDTVVRIMKRNLRDGEGFNYGLGSIRSTVANQFRSIAAIKKARNDIISAEDMDAVKTEIETEYEDLKAKLEPYDTVYSGDIFDDSLKELATNGASSFKDYYPNLPDDVRHSVSSFLGKLRNLPTEYFETKMQRAVGLNEFTGAVVPSDASKETIATLKSNGLSIVKYKPNDKAARENALERLSKRHGLLFQGSGGVRGSIQFPSTDLTDGASLLTIMETADLSTVLHEMGHFYFETLNHIATQPGAPQQIIDDVNTLINHAGIESMEAWNSMSIDERRAAHEQVAEEFEHYILEGRAPATGLRKLFRTLKSWMVSVYRNSLPRLSNLNDDVRSVFDRLVASEDEIAAARNELSADALLTTAEDAGMNDADYAQYLNDIKETAQLADELLSKRSVADMKWLDGALGKELRAIQADAAEKRKIMKAEVTDDIYSRPVYAAWRYLTHGIAPEGALIEGKTRLSTVALRDMYGKDDNALWRSLPIRSGKYSMVSKDGIHPDELAAVFGFDSGDALVRALTEADKPSDVIKSETNRRMLERYGDLVDESAQREAAMESLHNANSEKVIRVEYAALNKIAGQRGNITRNALRDYAEAAIGAMEVMAVRPNDHLRAERKAARAAQAAFGKADIQEAAKQKRIQMIQQALYSQAVKANNNAEKALNYLNKFNSPGVRKNIDRDYLDQIDAILEVYDLRKSVSNKAIQKRQALVAWIEQQKENGMEPTFDAAIIARKQHYKTLSVDDFLGVRDAVKQIDHFGRMKHKLLTAKDKREFDAIVDDASKLITENGKERSVQLEGRGTFKKFQENFRAGHRKLNSLFRQFDGGKDGGLIWELLGRTMNAASDKETGMIMDATQRLTEIYKPIMGLRGGLNGDKQYIPGIQSSLTRAGRLSVALNWGNETNRKRVMDGDNWNAEQVNVILKTLSPVEAKFVNDAWSLIDEFWPEVAAKEKRITGIEPEKVMAESFEMELSDGSIVTMRGGYYPIKYDTDRDQKSAQHEEEGKAKDMLRGAATRATTRRGHTKQRAEFVGRPVKKSLDVITQHISEVVHDLSWHEWLIDANRIIGSHRIDQAIRNYYGPSIVSTIKADILAIAGGDLATQDAVDTALLYLRSNISRSTMGLSATTGLLQPFGLFQSIVRIGPKHVFRGMARWAGDASKFENSMKWISEKSVFMKHRRLTFNKELREINGRVSKGHSKARQIYDASLFMLMQKMQLVADVPTWIGAYEKAIDEGNDDARSVALADQSVLDSQGGGETKDLSQFQTNHPMLMMFASYFNTTYNLMSESTAKTNFKDPLAVAGWISDMAMLAVIPALAPAIILELLKGGGSDDPEDWAKKLVQWEAGYLMGLMIGIREMSGAVQGFSYSGPPAGRLVSDAARLSTQVTQGDADRAAIEATVKILGSAMGIPSVQALRSYKGWEAWADGDAPVTSILVGPPPRD